MDGSLLTPVRTLIVDDEPWARERVRDLLESHPEVEIIGEAGGGLEAVELISEQQPELVLLDIQMPDLDGFGVLEQLGEALPAVIFITAYDQHALRAFQVHAVDYLLKPFERRRLQEAVDRAVQLIRTSSADERVARLEQLLSKLRPGEPGWLQRFLVRSHDCLYFVQSAAIDWIEACGNYVRLHEGARDHLVRQTMKGLEQRLDPAIFLRIHRSTIVNLDRIKELHPLFSGEYTVVLLDGTELTLSKGYRDRLLDFLADRNHSV